MTTILLTCWMVAKLIFEMNVASKWPPVTIITILIGSFDGEMCMTTKQVSLWLVDRDRPINKRDLVGGQFNIQDDSLKQMYCSYGIVLHWKHGYSLQYHRPRYEQQQFHLAAILWNRTKSTSQHIQSETFDINYLHGIAICVAKKSCFCWCYFIVG